MCAPVTRAGKDPAVVSRYILHSTIITIFFKRILFSLPFFSNIFKNFFPTVILKRGTGPYCRANNWRHGLHSLDRTPGVPCDGPEEEEGGGALQAGKTGVNLPPATTRYSAEGPSRGEADLEVMSWVGGRIHA